jgi:molybdopterin synthase catalytic subunit
MSIGARLVHASFDPAAELGAFAAAVIRAGAVASFTGVARASTRDGSEVTNLFLDHHPRLTQSSLTEAADAATARFELSAVCVIHRAGTIAPGEPIVFVAAASAHRRAAIEAVDYLMDRLKTDAVFWKREDAVDGSRWIEPTQDDRAARARWED